MIHLCDDRIGVVWGSQDAYLLGAPLFAADFSTQPGSGAYSLPAMLAIACTTTGRTAQTSAATLRLGFGANAARARSVDGTTWGLRVARSITNLIPNSDSFNGTNWIAGAMTKTAGKVDPAGGTAGVEFASAGGQYSDFDVSGTSGRAASVWAQYVSGASPAAHFRYDGASGKPFTDVTSAMTAWRRLEVILSVNTAGNINFETRDVPAGAGLIAGASTFRAFGAQAEADVLYPGDYVPVGVAAGKTADADVLSIVAPANVAPSGYFDATVVVAPGYATAEQGADHDLLFFDANNRVFVQQSTHKVVLRIGGADVASTALTWSREQAITVRAQHRASGRVLTVSGATTGSGSASAAAASPLSLPATAYLLGNSSGAQECADLRRVAFFPP